MTILTTRQQELLEYIEEHTLRFGYSPSFRDMAKKLNVKSTSTISGYLKGLEDAGYIRRNPNQSRSIELVADDEWRHKSLAPIPLVGSVHAGMPATAEECIEDVFPFSAQFIGSGVEDTFMLEVKGESMVDAGILPGDYLFVKSQNVAENGEIVVAFINDDEATVKTFYQEKGYIRLQPENESYEPIICGPESHIQIVGKVIGVYRKYN